MQWIIAIASCIGTSFWAKSKGYNPVAFFLTAGLAGWIFLAILKNLNKGDMTEEEKTKRKKSGDLAGWVISGLTLVLIIWLASLQRVY